MIAPRMATGGLDEYQGTGAKVDKVVGLQEAVAELVKDGDSVALEGFTHLIPTAAAHEIIRQERRHLTLIRMTPDLIYDQMIGMGCAKKLIFSWGGNPGVGSLHHFRDAVEHGWPQPLEIEEHSHAGMANRYVAGASSLPFAVLRGYVGTNLPKVTDTIAPINGGANEAWIVGAVRTPVGRHGGALSSVRPDDLGALVLEELMERTGVPSSEVEDVYMGCTNQAGEDDRDVARMSLLLAGFPVEVAGTTINRLCGSGLDAVANAARAIMVDEAQVYVGGGVESMSRAPWAVPKPSRAFPTGNAKMYDTTLGRRMVNPKMEALGHTDSLGMTAENLAQERFLLTPDENEPERVAQDYRITREENHAWRSNQASGPPATGATIQKSILLICTPTTGRRACGPLRGRAPSCPTP